MNPGITRKVAPLILLGMSLLVGGAGVVPETGGVRLGMTVTEAKAAITQLNSDFQLRVRTAHAANQPSFTWMINGIYEATKNDSFTREAYGEQVDVGFQLEPGREQVFAIHRTLSFRHIVEPNEPVRDDTLAGLRSKYGSKTSWNSDSELAWLYDTDGNLIVGVTGPLSNPKVACRKAAEDLTNEMNIGIGSNIPNWIDSFFINWKANIKADYGRCGLYIHASLAQSEKNPKLVSAIDLYVIDVAQAEIAFRRASETAEQSRAREQHEQLERARSNPPAIRY